MTAQGPVSVDGLDTPPELEVRCSLSDPTTLGVCCKKAVRQNARFGPLLGDRLQVMPSDANPEFLLKIVDKDTKELVFFVDASDSNTSSWMRYIQGAKTHKQQNIIPERDGSDIYLKATKDLSKGSELLVWFEENAGKNKKQPSKDDGIKTILMTWCGEKPSPRRGRPPKNKPKEATKSYNKLATKESKDNPKAQEKKKNVETEVNEELEAKEEEEKDKESVKADPRTDEEEAEDEDDVEEEEPSVQEDGKFQFELKPQHTIKSRLGRKVFQCDICSGVYRHAFSLKRHYIRNHINYRYVSKADLLNCQINVDTLSIPGGASAVIPAQSDDCKSQDRSKASECIENSTECNIKSETNDKVSDKENSDVNVDTSNTINSTVNNKLEEAQDKECHSSKASESDNDRQSPTSNSGLSESQETHSSKEVKFAGLYRCNVCGQLYDDIEALKTHIADHPEVPNMKAYACDSCDMKFTHKQNLMRHQAVHTGAKPYLCKFCGKKFPTATNQKRHERIHLGRRISCELCSSSFTQSGDLKKHVRKLHPECFHECAFCGKYYSTEESLEEHLTTHQENLATNQEEATRRRHAFKVNMEQDMAESMRLAEQRPGFKYACTVCKKRFHDYANMCRHRRLAHQRHLLISKRAIKNEMEEATSPTTSNNDNTESDSHSYFFANVARNIAENLKYFVEGGQDNLNNPDEHIKWKKENEYDPVPHEDPPVTNSNPHENYSTYNFPLGFEPQSNYHKQVESTKDKTGTNKVVGSPVIRNNIVLSVPSFHMVNKDKNGLSISTVDLTKVKQEPGLGLESYSQEFKQRDQADVLPNNSLKHFEANIQTAKCSPTKPSTPKSDTSQEAKRSPTPISVPKVRICSICHSIFHKGELFQAHMKSRHKVDILLEDSPPINLPPSHTLSPPETPVKTPNVPFVSYQQKEWTGTIAAMDLSNNAEPQLYDLNGALDLTSPVKKTFSPDLCLNTEVTERSCHSTPSQMQESNHGLTKYLCRVCYEEYPDLETLYTHQRATHANLACDELALIGDINFNWPHKPNPVGLLNVSCSQVPTADDYTTGDVKYTCTKCKAQFTIISELHNHIVECAMDNNTQSRNDIRPIHHRPRLKFAKGLGWVSFRHSRHILEKKAKLNQVKKRAKRAFLKKIITRQSDVTNEILLPRRRSMELLYNPSKHVRRREMTEVLDMHRCRGCGYRFSTISLLERHIKVCTYKDRIKELQVMKPTLRGANNTLSLLSKRHMCHYCKKNFTYIGGLKKHIFDICSVRKQIKEENGKLNQSWEDNIVAMLLARDAAQEEEVLERAGRKRRGRRKNHRWGYGKKKKSTDNDKDEDEESVTSMISTTESTTGDAFFNDEHYMDDDSQSGCLVIDMKEDDPYKNEDSNASSNTSSNTCSNTSSKIEHLPDNIDTTEQTIGNAENKSKQSDAENTTHTYLKRKSSEDQSPLEKKLKIDINEPNIKMEQTALHDSAGGQNILHEKKTGQNILTEQNITASLITEKSEDRKESLPVANSACEVMTTNVSEIVARKSPVTYNTLKVPVVSVASLRQNYPKAVMAKTVKGSSMSGSNKKSKSIHQNAKTDTNDIKGDEKNHLETQKPGSPKNDVKIEKVVKKRGPKKGSVYALNGKDTGSAKGLAGENVGNTVNEKKPKSPKNSVAKNKTYQAVNSLANVTDDKNINAKQDESPIKIKTGAKVKTLTLSASAKVINMSPLVSTAAQLIVPNPAKLTTPITNQKRTPKAKTEGSKLKTDKVKGKTGSPKAQTDTNKTKTTVTIKKQATKNKEDPDSNKISQDKNSSDSKTEAKTVARKGGKRNSSAVSQDTSAAKKIAPKVQKRRTTRVS